MGKTTKKREYALRANVASTVRDTLTKVQGKLMLKGEPHNLEDAIEHICSEYDKNNKS